MFNYSRHTNANVQYLHPHDTASIMAEIEYVKQTFLWKQPRFPPEFLAV